jgi:uncharacterized protein YutE (UPF0331/DUF86 family)
MIAEPADDFAGLEGVVPRLRAEGFDVYVRPSGDMLPPFMAGYVPPAIALRGDRKLAIEILREDPASKDRLEKAHRIFADRKDWQLRVFWLNPLRAYAPLGSASRERIAGAIEGVERLAEDGRAAPALLMAWAAFEALGRALLPEKLSRPQTAGGLVEAMAFEGYLLPEEADFVRQLAYTRNQVAHGALDIDIPAADLKGFVEILKNIEALTRRP